MNNDHKNTPKVSFSLTFEVHSIRQALLTLATFVNNVFLLVVTKVNFINYNHFILGSVLLIIRLIFERCR